MADEKIQAAGGEAEAAEGKDRVAGVLGFAIKDAGGICIRTVGPTRISAKVNWLCVEAAIIVPRDADDALVDIIFDKLARRAGVTCVCVEVRVL